MPQTFRAHSPIQAIISIDTPEGGADELIVNCEVGSEYPVTLRVVEDEEDQGVYVLTAENAQKLVDWLRSKGVVS